VSSTRAFDFYEFVAYLVPGVTLLLAFRATLPAVFVQIFPAGLDAPNLLPFLFLAYLSGFILQGFGTILEDAYWTIWKGKPTLWVLTEEQDLVSHGQKDLLVQTLSAEGLIQGRSQFQELSKAAWWAISRHMRTALESGTTTTRVQLLSAVIGMSRGILAALTACAALTIYSRGIDGFLTTLVLLILIALTLHRLHRFGVYYAREVIDSYITVKRTEKH
jgi:hypothetical protein